MVKDVSAWFKGLRFGGLTVSTVTYKVDSNTHMVGARDMFSAAILSNGSIEDLALSKKRKHSLK